MNIMDNARSSSTTKSAFTEPVGKLLSLCTMGRNDNYEPDYLYRMTTSVNYMAAKLKDIGRLSDTEILITDWGSEVPLSEVLRFSPEAASITRFIFAPPSLVTKVGNGVAEFNGHEALNITLRRATGQFSIIIGADTFLSHSSLKTLFDIFSGSMSTPFNLKETYFMVPRFDIPFGYIDRQPDIHEIDRIVSTHTMAFDKSSYHANGGSAAALIASSEMWNKLAGLYYTNAGYGFSDTDALERLSRHHAYADTMAFGVFCYHMGHPIKSHAAEIRKKHFEVKGLKVKPLSWKEGEPADWGFAAEDLEFRDARAGIGNYYKTTVRKSHLDQTDLNMLNNNEVKETILKATTTLMNFSAHVRARICPDGIHIQDLDAMYILSWWAMHYSPSSFLVCPFDDVRVPSTLSVAGSLSTDMYAIIQQEGMVSMDEIWYRQVEHLQFTFGHRGYLRVVNGPLETAIDRLCSSMIRKPSFDLILFQIGRLGDSWRTMLRQSWERLDLGGAMIICDYSKESFDAQWNETKGIIGSAAQYIRFTDCGAGIIYRVGNDVPKSAALNMTTHLYTRRKLYSADVILHWIRSNLSRQFYFIQLGIRAVTRFFFGKKYQ